MLVMLCYGVLIRLRGAKNPDTPDTSEILSGINEYCFIIFCHDDILHLLSVTSHIVSVMVIQFE